jgi:hypothetical protein
VALGTETVRVVERDRPSPFQAEAADVVVVMTRPALSTRLSGVEGLDVLMHAFTIGTTAGRLLPLMARGARLLAHRGLVEP